MAEAAPQIGFVHGLGVVEVIGRGPEDLITVRVQATGSRHHVDVSELGPLDSAGARASRLLAMKAAQDRRGKVNGAA